MKKRGKKSFNVNNNKLNTPKKYQVEESSFGFSWRLKHLCLDSCSTLLLKDFLEVVEKLQHLETSTWSDLLQVYGGKRRGNNHHFFDVQQLPKDKQAYLNERFQGYDEGFSLRLSGKVRLIGVKDSSIFYVLWYDSNHKILESKKIHT